MKFTCAYSSTYVQSFDCGLNYLQSCYLSQFLEFLTCVLLQQCSLFPDRISLMMVVHTGVQQTRNLDRQFLLCCWKHISSKQSNWLNPPWVTNFHLISLWCPPTSNKYDENNNIPICQRALGDSTLYCLL